MQRAGFAAGEPAPSDVETSDNALGSEGAGGLAQYRGVLGGGMADDDLLYAGADDALYVRDRADASAVGQRYPALLSEALKQREVGTAAAPRGTDIQRSEEHTSELQSLMRISYAVFCLKK